MTDCATGSPVQKNRRHLKLSQTIRLSMSPSLFRLVLVIGIFSLTSAQGFNWQYYTPGGDSVCGHGTPYSFFFKVGTNDRVTVFFEGGGACWDAGSCMIPGLWTDSVDIDQNLSDLSSREGLLSNDPRSPIYNDTVLYLPYCTGDVHTGTKLSSYLIAHVGRINVDTALTYFQKTVLPTSMPQGPVQVNVMGCSAGSLGAFINAPFVFERFPAALHTVWGDSEVGVVSPNQWSGAWNNWGIQLGNVPGLEPRYTKAYRTDITGYIIYTTAHYYSHALFGAYSSNSDAVQSGFYYVGGGTQDWTTLMRTELSEVVGNSSNVYTYIAPGDAHCRNDDDGFWSVQSGTPPVILSDWVSSLVALNKSTARAVDCSQSGC